MVRVLGIPCGDCRGIAYVEHDKYHGTYSCCCDGCQSRVNRSGRLIRIVLKDWYDGLFVHGMPPVVIVWKEHDA